MVEIFNLVLVTSLYAGVVGLVIVLLKAILKNRINAFWHYFIWVVLILKLLVPFGPESAVSLFNGVPVQVVQSKVASIAPQVEQEYAGGDMSAVPAPDTSPLTPVQAQKPGVSLKVLPPYIWAVGAALMLLCLLISNYSLHRRLRKNMLTVDERVRCIFEKCKKKIGATKNIEIILQDVTGAPSLFGIIRPKILLTPAASGLSDKELEYILLHELAHYKRKDVFINYLLLVLQTVHWFNPVIWYCFKRLRQDMEAATDEKVLSILESSEHKEYGKALLAVLDGYNYAKPAPRLLGMVDDRKNIEERIKMINMAGLFQRNKRLVMVMGIFCVVLLCGVLLTNGRHASTRDKITDKNSIMLAGYDASILLKYKSPYIGDNSNISNLLSALPLGECKKGISLDTEKEPYGLTVNYELTQEFQWIDIDLESAVLLPNSMIIFSLIDNLDKIQYNIREGEGGKKYTYTRSSLQIYFERDLRDYTNNKNEFEGFLSRFKTNGWKSLALLNYFNSVGVNLNNVKEIRIEDFKGDSLFRAQTANIFLVNKIVNDLNRLELLPMTQTGTKNNLTNGVYLVFNTGERDEYFYIDYTTGGIAKYAPFMSSWPMYTYRFLNKEAIKPVIDKFIFSIAATGDLPSETKIAGSEPQLI